MKKLPGRTLKPVTKGTKIYYICLVIYTLILIGLGAWFLSYAEDCLSQYEASQPAYTMDAYLDTFSAEVNAGRLPAELVVEDEVGFFEPSTLIEQTFLDSMKSGFLHYEKAPGNYQTEHPAYRILSGATPVAEVTLGAENEHVIFGILTIMDWHVESVKPFFSVERSDYYVEVPEGFAVTVNGKEVTQEYLTGENHPIEELKYVAQYVECPQVVEYKIPELIMQPEVKIFDNKGAECTVTANGNRYTAYYSAAADMPEDRYEYALSNAQTWSLFMTNDIKESDRGLSTVRKFLIPDSDYDKLAKGWARGIDITFTSAHTLMDPPFEDVVVSDYIEYNDHVYSCHIYFNKTIYLTRKNEYRVDTSDMTYVIVYTDVTDDGVDNPDWYIADMITSVEE